MCQGLNCPNEVAIFILYRTIKKFETEASVCTSHFFQRGRLVETLELAQECEAR